MIWTLAVLVVVLLHLAFLIYQMLGALLVLVSRVWLVPHLATVAWGVGIVVVGGSCPLTVLEKNLIERAGGTPYQGSFLNHHVFGTLLPDGSQAFVYGAHLVVIVATYVYVVTRHRRRSIQRAAGPGNAKRFAGSRAERG